MDKKFITFMCWICKNKWENNNKKCCRLGEGEKASSRRKTISEQLRDHISQDNNVRDWFCPIQIN